MTTNERITEFVNNAAGRRFAGVLSRIEAADTDYEVRYGLVLGALALAHQLGYPAGIGWDLESGPDFDGFRAVVYIELPGEGQISWHMPEWDRGYDGHTTAQKYERCRSYAQRLQAELAALLASREEASAS